MVDLPKVIICKVVPCQLSSTELVDFGTDQPKFELPYPKFQGFYSRVRSVCVQATEIRKRIKVSSFYIRTFSSPRSKRFFVKEYVFTPLIDFSKFAV